MTQHAAQAERTVRRKPVQERSRRTVAAILDAAEAIVDESGVSAATTRAIADRASVAYPSLYRFFSDRDEILDDLLERHTMAVDDLAIAGEQTWEIRSPMDLMNAEFDLQVEYYRAHPSAARLWLTGRLSEAVTDFVQRRKQALSARIYNLLTERGIIPADTDPRGVLLAVEFADRAMEVAYRGRDDFDEEMLAAGRFAINAYVQSLELARA
ncbi:MAG TPA: helix-turn-helix domain-containing protein [Marmoricola sp.]|nr:helix-turn-helix domain-containing protein [Marmoricola sp.]